MAITFSQVTLESKLGYQEFFTTGFPKNIDELEGYTAFEEFMMELDDGDIVDAHVEAYLYGEGETFRATIEEVAYMIKRLEANPRFLADRCQNIGNFSFEFEVNNEELFGYADDDVEGARIVALGDECNVILPSTTVDCTKHGYFDELEEDCWNLIKSYASKLGIDIIPDEDGDIPVDYEFSKAVQNLIINRFRMAGLHMQLNDKDATPEENAEAIEKIRNLTDDDLSFDNVLEFNSLHEFFKFMYEDESAYEIMSKLSDDERMRLLESEVGERVLQVDGKYYFCSEGIENIQSSDEQSGSMTL